MPAIRVNITRARSDTSIVAPGEVAGKGKFGTTPSGSSPDVNIMMRVRVYWGFGKLVKHYVPLQSIPHHF